MVDKKDKGKLVHVKFIRASELSKEEQEEAGVSQGTVIVETRICREISISEVDEIVQLYKKDVEKAYDLYEQRIEETVDIMKNILEK